MTLTSKIASLSALCLVVGSIAGAQSLADLAKKERERREKNKSEGVSVREYSEDQIFEDENEHNEDGDSADSGVEGVSGSDADGEPDSDSTRKSPIPDRIDIPLGADSDNEDLQDESRQREQQEAEWRNRFADARERVAHAREQKAIWDGVHYVEGITLFDENGNPIVQSLDDLRRFVDQAGRELSEAESALKALEEEARRAGVPPGWLR